MLASKLALTVLLVSLGSALANPADSEVAERREGDYENYKIEVVLINKLKKEVFELRGVQKKNGKAVLLLKAAAGKYVKGVIYPYKFDIIIAYIDGVFVQSNSDVGFVADYKAVAKGYPFGITALNLNEERKPLGFRVEICVIYPRRRYEEEERRYAEEERREEERSR